MGGNFGVFSRLLSEAAPSRPLDPSPTIPSLVVLFVPMHCARGRLVAPSADGRLLRMCGVSVPKGRTPAGDPAKPEATSRSGVRHSPRLSAASASAAAAAAAVSAARDTDDVEVCGGELQPVLSPPARLVAKSCICNWAQAIQCALPHVEPEPCQGEWERREGYGDTVARRCCLHHPDY